MEPEDGSGGEREQPGDQRADGADNPEEDDRPIYVQVRERRLADYEADPRSFELPFAIARRKAGWDEDRLRAMHEWALDEADFEMLMAIQPDVLDDDGDVIEPEDYEYFAALYRRACGFDEPRLRAMFGDALSEEQYATALAVAPDEEAVLGRHADGKQVNPDYLMSVAIAHRKEGWDEAELRARFGDALSEQQYADLLKG